MLKPDEGSPKLHVKDYITTQNIPPPSFGRRIYFLVALMSGLSITTCFWPVSTGRSDKCYCQAKALMPQSTTLFPLK